MSTLPLTPAEITAAAVDYNAEYPDAAGQITAGAPVVRVTCSTDPRNTRAVIVVVAPGVALPDGGFAGACDPETFTLRRFDGRLSPVEIAARSAHRIGIASVTAPLEWVDGRR